MSHEQETREIVTRLKAIYSDYRLSSGNNSNFKNLADHDQFIDGLRKAEFD